MSSSLFATLGVCDEKPMCLTMPLSLRSLTKSKIPFRFIYVIEIAFFVHAVQKAEIDVICLKSFKLPLKNIFYRFKLRDQPYSPFFL